LRKRRIGRLIDRKWRDVWYDMTATGGRRAERD
jgi:hypothetical protein